MTLARTSPNLRLIRTRKPSLVDRLLQPMEVPTVYILALIIVPLLDRLLEVLL